MYQYKNVTIEFEDKEPLLVDLYIHSVKVSRTSPESLPSSSSRRCILIRRPRANGTPFSRRWLRDLFVFRL